MNPEKLSQIDSDSLGLLVHSYNNHLAAMMGYTEITLLDCSDKSSREKLALSLEAGKEAVALGNDVLASIGRLQVQMQLISVADLLAAVKEIEGVRLDPSSVKHSVYKKLKMQANLGMLVDCLKELISFTGWKSQCVPTVLKIDTQANHLNLTILSESAIFNDKELKCLFNPFYSTRTLRGTKDIGLSKVQGFLSQIKADIKWKNGTGFFVSIPLSSD